MTTSSRMKEAKLSLIPDLTNGIEIHRSDVCFRTFRVDMQKTGLIMAFTNTSDSP